MHWRANIAPTAHIQALPSAKTVLCVLHVFAYADYTEERQKMEAPHRQKAHAVLFLLYFLALTLGKHPVGYGWHTQQASLDRAGKGIFHSLGGAVMRHKDQGHSAASFRLLNNLC